MIVWDFKEGEFYACSVCIVLGGFISPMLELSLEVFSSVSIPTFFSVIDTIQFLFSTAGNRRSIVSNSVGSEQRIICSRSSYYWTFSTLVSFPTSVCCVDHIVMLLFFPRSFPKKTGSWAFSCCSLSQFESFISHLYIFACVRGGTNPAWSTLRIRPYCERWGN